MTNYSEIASEAGPEAVLRIAELIAGRLSVNVLRAPSPAMVMMRQVDPMENAIFNLGEIFVMECEVEVDGHPGYGCVVGPADDRSLCSALLDAVFAARPCDHGRWQVTAGAPGVFEEICRAAQS